MTRLEDLADSTLFDENTKFILIDDANKEIPSNMTMKNWKEVQRYKNWEDKASKCLAQNCGVPCQRIWEMWKIVGLNSSKNCLTVSSQRCLMNQKQMGWHLEPRTWSLDGRPTPWSSRVRGGWRPGTPPTLTLAKARIYQNLRGGVLSGPSPFSMDKVQTIVLLH